MTDNMTDNYHSAAFAAHMIAREKGWTWRCAKPGTSNYAFRVTWCPWNIVVTGDLGSIVITHYSFSDPWSAAAWVNGAGWDYFMEKSSVSKEYSPRDSAEFIVEIAYRQLRDNPGSTRALAMFERIIDVFGSYDDEATDPQARKEACRSMLESDLTSEQAYEISEDTECCLMRYPESERWKYAALKTWARWMWDNEPTWHRAVRIKRRIAGEWADMKRFPIVFAPVLYARFDKRGQMITFNGSKTWRWAKCKNGRRYEAVVPARLMGRSLAPFGIWRVHGSTWSDDPVEESKRFGRECFRDLTAEQIAQVAA